MPVVTDALGRSVRLAGPPRRIVSLVPSETEAVCDLVGEGRLVGCTDYCEEPPGLRERLPSVGGTKKFDVDAVVALEPDLVLANKEENGRKLVEALLARGLPVHVSFPTTVSEALDYLASLAVLLGVDPTDAPVIRRAREAYDRAAVSSVAPLRTFVPIWMDPLMTFDGRVLASDLLELCGGTNVFSDRPRRYPLAADLGRAPALTEARVGDRDTRYPRITLAEVESRKPQAILLPDEPHAFTEDDAAVFRARAFPAATRERIVFCSGKDLFWYGTRLAGSIERITALTGSLRPGPG